MDSVTPDSSDVAEKVVTEGKTKNDPRSTAGSVSGDGAEVEVSKALLQNIQKLLLKAAENELAQDDERALSPEPIHSPGPEIAGYYPGEELKEYAPIPTLLAELTPTIHKCNYEEFKNFYRADDLKYVVQALYGGNSLKNDIQRETDRRRSRKRHQIAQYQDKSSLADKKVLHRVRIHSPCILSHIYQIEGKHLEEPWKSHTFFRPFKLLIDLQPKMKKAVEKLEETWGEGCPLSPIAEASLGSTVPQSPIKSDDEKSAAAPEDKIAEQNNETTPTQEELELEDTEKMLDSREAYLHMRAYVKFVDDEIMPLIDQFNGTETRKIMFTDLWYLFREGDLIYSPPPSSNSRNNDPSSTANTSSLMTSYQSTFRLYSIVCPPTPDDPENVYYHTSDNSNMVYYSGNDDDTYDEQGNMRLCVYYINFDGEQYGPVQRQFHIQRFEGERDIKALPVYPTRFLKDEKAYLSSLRKIGELFKQRASAKHLYHFGWTLTYGLFGTLIDNLEIHPEHIDSEVILDLVEAFQTWPGWKPDIHVPSAAVVSNWSAEEYNNESILNQRYTVDRDSSEVIFSALIRSDGAALKRRNKYLEDDSFFVRLKKGDYVVPEDDELVLLPKRLIVYSLRERKFVVVETSSLKPLKQQSDVFESLKINEDHKKMVRSLIREHFRHKQQRHEGKEVMNQDLIRGKGAGLVFLLHGVPGVGKTATAEAVAQENGKPLFAITTGDLGFEPTDVEKNLTRIFRLANLWDCVLLLDEADIFFTKRSPTDLQRNALVSVFLRILEYYSGILFLTTNRVGIIDEAFKSRIHISLYYPPLDSKQTKQIFQLNIKRLVEIEKNNKKLSNDKELEVDEESILAWAENQFLTNQEDVGRWNGRQIRNAFQIAASLAHYDIFDDEQQPLTEGSKRGTLNSAQFATVAKATKEFDIYMAKARKGTDAEMAKKSGTRDDRYVTTTAVAVFDGVYGSTHSHRDSYYRGEQGGAYPSQGGQRMYPPAQQQEYGRPPAIQYDRRDDRRPPPDTYGQPRYAEPNGPPRHDPLAAGIPFGHPRASEPAYDDPYRRGEPHREAMAPQEIPLGRSGPEAYPPPRAPMAQGDFPYRQPPPDHEYDRYGGRDGRVVEDPGYRS